MGKYKPKTFRPTVTQLEGREVPAIASAQVANGVLTVVSDDSPTIITVNQAATGISVRDVSAGQTFAFAARAVNQINVFGGDANDTITSRGNVGKVVRLYGLGGNDVLNGGAAKEVMYGNGGNDTLLGGGNDDALYGAGGNDKLDAGAGNDVLDGGAGDDWMKGGDGIDTMRGGLGDDTIISLDGILGDVVEGGGGENIIWRDLINGATDLVSNPTALDTVQSVDAFDNPDAPTTLNGERIPDPVLLPAAGPSPGIPPGSAAAADYETFANRPLFPSEGPGAADISQGALGDCWLLAGFGSTANAYPDLIRQRVVDFGDGTYGVKLGDNFYRVDNDFAVDVRGSLQLNYTAFGRENSVWVPVLEKAYTYYRVGAGTYASIEGGYTFDSYPSFGLDPRRVWLNQNGSNPTAAQINDIVRLLVDSGYAATIGFDTVPPGLPLIEAHQYILRGYNLDPISGQVASVVLQNPWGTDGPGTAPSPANGNDPDFEDAIVTITVNQLMTTQGSFEWGVPS